jgi:hypothetical protein
LYHNTAVVLDVDGSLAGIYRKGMAEAGEAKAKVQ